ncbi:MAG: RidA family protein [Elusimicrobia bacterium]|nr:RidA family protein [Elusimicrobiota bacterium]
MKKIISTEKAPKAIGPYSQAVSCGELLFVSGQLPLDPQTGTMPKDIKEQTEAVLKNIKAVAQAAGTSMENALKTTVYMTDLSLFSQMNEKYSEFFSSNPPARATVEVKALPKGAAVEIEAIFKLP